MSHETTQPSGDAHDSTCLFDPPQRILSRNTTEILYFDFTCPDQREFISQDTHFHENNAPPTAPSTKTSMNYGFNAEIRLIIGSIPFVICTLYLEGV